MKYILLFFTLLILQISCSRQVDYSKQPITINPLWEELDSELKLKFGQQIKVESLDALVAAISQDEGGIWYGLCFFNEQGLFGRQIPSGLSTTGCVDLLDIEFINERNLPTIKIIDTLNIIRQIAIGKEAPATSYADLNYSYKRGLKRRTQKQTPCDEGAYELNPIRECYFPLDWYGK